jgi:hypothetical protein
MRCFFRGIFFSLIFLLITLFLGCASVQLPQQSLSGDSLKETASLYWKLRLEKDEYKEIFKIEEPEALKKLNLYDEKKFDEYVSYVSAIKNIGISSYTVKNIRIKDNTGLVDMEFMFSLPQIPKPAKQILTDEWIYRDGRWLHVLK